MFIFSQKYGVFIWKKLVGFFTWKYFNLDFSALDFGQYHIQKLSVFEWRFQWKKSGENYGNFIFFFSVVSSFSMKKKQDKKS